LHDRLWVIGGEGGGATVDDAWKRDVWSSADGIHWQPATAKAHFNNRIFHAAAGFNGRLWVFGGDGSSGKLRDVWSSVNGTDWRVRYSGSLRHP